MTAQADVPVSAPALRRPLPRVIQGGMGVAVSSWQIAASVARPGQDVRDVVVEVQKLNGMSDSSLVAGEELVVPALG